MEFINFKKAYSELWKKDSDFVVTIDATESDYRLWPSMGLKIATKNVKPNSPIANINCIDNLPNIILNEIENSELKIPNGQKNYSHQCLVIGFQKAPKDKDIIRLLGYAITQNMDIHILSPENMKNNGFEQLQKTLNINHFEQHQDCKWFIYKSDDFTNKILLRN